MTEIYIADTRQGTVNISSGSTTITGNDSDFTSADIGKQIRIRTRDGYQSFGITNVVSRVEITVDTAPEIDQDNCYYNTDYKLLDVPEAIKMPVTYSIFDITEPDKRGGTRSKTLVLPGTANNNIIFNHIFQIDGSGTFNPNIKADCIIYQDTIEIFRGSFRLLQVSRTFDTISYECAVMGRVTNIYSAFGDKTLSDLDLSEFDHDYTQTVQANSWILTSTHGFVYPIIDYGETDASEQTIWQVNQLYPAVYVKALIDKMFEMAGFTYSSSFFDSDLFNKLIIPFNAGTFKYSEAEVNSRLFEAGIVSGGTSLSTSSVDEYAAIPYNNVSTDPYFDTSAQFDTSTHTWTVAKSGHYNITLLTILEATFTNLTGLTFDLDYPSYVEMVIVRGGVTLPVKPYMQDDISGYLHYGGSGAPFTVSITSVFEKMYLVENDEVSFRVHLLPAITAFSLHVDIKNDSYVYDDVINETMTEGDQVVMADVVPHNVRLADFFRSITNMFNLYIDEDNDIPNRLNIEPGNDFYNGGILLDWTSKWDKSQAVNIIPMGELTAQNYLFTYRADQDYWNDRYSKKYISNGHNEIYGEYWLAADNDFLTETQNIELVFAPTILSQYKINSLIIPSIRFIDSNGGVASDKTDAKSSVIRILYYGGLKTGNWTFRNLASGSPDDIPETEYPYAGHFDDPINPTLDLNFGLPGELYYQAKGQSVTDNNLYNNFYSAHFDEIMDKDSKVVEMTLHLTPVDIHSLDFRNSIFIDGQYYRLMEITDYDLVNPQLTQCRFMKVKTGKPFVAATHTVTGGKGGTVGNQKVPVLDYKGIPVKGVVIGKNNSNASGGVLVTGNGNDVSGKNVQVFGGNNNTVNANNVTLINSSGLTINDNGVTYIDGEKYYKASTISGQATQAAGTVIIALPGISSASIILISYTGDGTLTGTLSVTAGTGLFTIDSTSPADTAVVNWYVARF